MANPIEKWFKIIDYDLLTDLQLALHLGRQGKVVENEFLSEVHYFWLILNICIFMFLELYSIINYQTLYLIFFAVEETCTLSRYQV